MNTKQFEALRARDEMFKLLLRVCNDFIKKRIKMSDFKVVVRQVNQVSETERIELLD